VSDALLQAGLDSVAAAAVILDDPARARALLNRAVKRAPLDSIPFLDRNYDQYLAVAALAGDTALVRKWHAESRRSWQASGKTTARPAWEAMDDAMVAMSEGRYSEALAKVDESDRRLNPRTDIVAQTRFLILDRMQRTDSAISAGESYLAGTHPNRFGQDALFLAGIRQRLGEMYESKGNLEKALTNYEAFVTLWKDADPELQPRVRDVRGRVDRIREQLRRKG
jgi:tetratricopeptide (TPR) repeat protein